MEDYNKLLNQYEKLKEENKRLREDYVILQNASDEYENRLLDTIDEAIKFVESEYNTFSSAKEWRNALLRILKDNHIDFVL